MLIRSWARPGIAVLFSVALVWAAGVQTPKPLFEAGSKLTPSSSRVTVTGADVVIDPGEDQFPGVALSPATPWDLSGYGHVEARVRNTGATPLGISLRVDNAGDWKDNPWNTETVTISAGQVATVKTIFGYSYGLKPGFKLNPSAVTRLLLFTDKPSETVAFRVESIVADGPKGEGPLVAEKDVKIKPKDGLIFGPEVGFDVAKQVMAKDATVTLEDKKLKITFAAGGSSVALRPSVGQWDLRDFNKLTLSFSGGSTAMPVERLNTAGGSYPPGRDVFTSDHFTNGVAKRALRWSSPYDIGAKSGGTPVTIDAVQGITFTAREAGVIIVDSIKATVEPAVTPTWLGKRPPVEGKWVKTLDEEFDGAAINDKIWNVKGENYYDKVSHWSKDNVLVGNGQASLRYEKKKGFQNDDPKRNETTYASGFLDTYGKWTQKYGYFEARMKLPSAPGLWPAFWMMPDRGAATGEQWQRQDTKNGGMEFDIMEHLTRWGPFRYNVAVHYDGYEKEHKSLGTDKIYVQADKDGFLTCGLLWEPGLAVWYCNGIEVARWKDERVSSAPSNLMFTLPSGGWDNDAIDDAKLPSAFVIDYVRVWKRG